MHNWYACANSSPHNNISIYFSLLFAKFPALCFHFLCCFQLECESKVYAILNVASFTFLVAVFIAIIHPKKESIVSVDKGDEHNCVNNGRTTRGSSSSNSVSLIPNN